MSPALHSSNINFLDGQARIPSIARFLLAAAVLVTKWERLHKTRKTLKNLDYHQLNDIGLNKFDAQNEAEKPFWKS